jgi:hypothetical protein
MKLQDLAAPQKTRQVAKVMESYFGQSINFESISKRQAHNMLTRVRGLISEHRRQPAFHSSEQNPAYLKLVMMEQALASKLSEEVPVAPGATTATAPGQTPAQSAALQAQQQVQKRKQIQDQIATKRKELADLQKQLTMAESGHSLRRKLKESEVQQAQVILASQDMVDQVQKMIEQTTAVQFKDLPALVDQIRNEVGYDQATQFNTDATAALSGLVQNLQASKGQLEQALGVVTGQAPTVPGAEVGADLGAEVGADLGAEVGAELPPPGEEEVDLDIDAEEEPSSLATSLGRGKR